MRIFKKLISSLLVILLFLGWLPAYFSPNVESATLSGGSLTLGDSRPSTSTTYTIDFDNVTTSAIKCIKVVLSDAATGGSAPSGINTSGVTYSAANSDYIPDAQTWTAEEITTGSFKITNSTGETPASSTDRTIQVSGITNGSSANTTYYAQFSTYNNTDCTSSSVDSGVVAFIYTTGQAVSATVDPTLTFTLSAVNSGTPIKSGGPNATVTTTTSTIPFGTLVANTEKFAAHTLTVSTNAQSGYGITIRTASDPPLSDGGSNNIDKFTGTYGTPTAWSDPNGTSANVDTGWFGYTTDDATFTQFSGNVYAGPSGTTGDLIVDRSSAANNEQNNVGYVIGINGIQPSAIYNGTVIFVATPTY